VIVTRALYCDGRQVKPVIAAAGFDSFTQKCWRDFASSLHRRQGTWPNSVLTQMFANRVRTPSSSTRETLEATDRIIISELGCSNFVLLLGYREAKVPMAPDRIGAFCAWPKRDDGVITAGSSMAFP